MSHHVRHIGTHNQVVACLESNLFTILDNQTRIGDKIIIIVTRTFLYWDFEDRSLQAGI